MLITAGGVEASSTCSALREPSYIIMRKTKQPQLDDDRHSVKSVSLGCPFNCARQPWLAPVRVPFDRAVQLVVALDAVLRCYPSTTALDTALEESRLALRSGRKLSRGYSGGGSGGSRELEAMKEVLHVLWPRVGPDVSSNFPARPYADEDIFFMVRWVLLHLKGHSGEEGEEEEEEEEDDRDRAILGGALARQIMAINRSARSSSPSLFLSSAAPSANGVAPPERHGGTTAAAAAAAVASLPTECPSPVVSAVERESTVACSHRSSTTRRADHPRAKTSCSSGLRVDTSWGKTPVPSSTSLRGTAVAVAVAGAGAGAGDTATAAATTTTTTTTNGGTSSFAPSSRSNQRIAHTAGRQMEAQEGTVTPQERGGRGKKETPSFSYPPPQRGRGRPLRLCTPPSPCPGGSRPDLLPSPPAATSCPSGEFTEGDSCTTSPPSSPSAKEGLVAACASPSSPSRWGRRRSPSSPRGRPASPVCQQQRGRPCSPSSRLARPGSTSPSTRRRAAAVCSPVALINCSFPKAKTEDDLDGSTASATPPLTPLQVTPPGSRARSSGVSPASRSPPPPPRAENAESSARTRRSEPHGFFKDDDEPTKAVVATTTAAGTTTTPEGDPGVASTPLRSVPHAKQRSCRDKIGFYGLLSRNARGRSDGRCGGGGGGTCNNGGACDDIFPQAAAGTDASINEEPLMNGGRAAPEAFPASLEQNPDMFAAAVAAADAAAADAATDAATAINTTLAAATTTTTTTTTTTATDSTTATTATATAADGGRRAARRVSWSPLVLARDEAATAIKSFVARFRKSEVIKRRVAHDQAAARLFLIRRRAEREREREGEGEGEAGRGGGRRAASRRRPVAQRGGFFRLLWSLERSDLRGYRMWSDPGPFIAFVPLGSGGLVRSGSGGGGGGGSIDCCSQPVPWTLGDFVRRMATDLLNRGQARRA